MERYPERRSILCNIACDLRTGSVPRNVAVGIVRIAISRWWKRRHGIPPDYLLSEYASAHRLCYCLGPSIKMTAADQVSRVLAAKDLQHNIRTHRFLAEVPRRTIRMWENGIRPRLAHGQATGPLGFAWVTRRTELDSLLSARSGDARARTATDVLGLAHKLRGGQLVILDYPTSPVGLTLHKPTFIDGSDNFAFESTSSPMGWGKTRCLSGASPGCSEGVHRAIPFTSLFKVRYLGQLRAYDLKINHKLFYGHTPVPWHRRLRAWLLQLLS